MEISELHKIFLSCGSITTDTRKIQLGGLFFALKGENFDGNDFAVNALEFGAAYVVVNAGSPADNEREAFMDASGVCRVITVEDTLKTLQELAAYHRDQTFVDGKRLTVIGLTGTNGKTTTKELIRTVLSTKYNVTATEGNLNNDIGVPMSLLKINADTQLAVIEMGASHLEDIRDLTSISHPDFGLITNVGKAHLLGFGSYEGVKKAKGRMYDYVYEHGGMAFVNADDPVLTEMAAQRKGMKTIPYGIAHSGARVLPSSADFPFVRIMIPSAGGEIELDTHLVGAYNANNVMAAIGVGNYFGVPLEDAVKAISEYIPSNNRSQMQKTDSNVLIVDAYNANPTSMAAALDNFSLVEASHKVALLGDMRELGADSVFEHIKVLREAEGLGIDSIYLVGEEFHKALVNVGQRPNVQWYATSEELAAAIHSNPLKDCTVLVKGSRGTTMEKVIPEL